jgi:hypothetical protein
MWVWAAGWALAADRTWNGLELGATDAAGIDAWAAGRGLACETVPSPRRTTTHIRCDAPSPAAIAAPAGPGSLQRLLLVRTDDGPLHHVSTERAVDTGAAAAAYDAAVARWTAVYGPPTRSAPAPTRFDSPLVRSATEWVADDLVVRVSLLRNGGVGPVRITERWDIPGVEEQVPTRPGSVPVHGPGSPSAKNPHLEED